MSGVRVYELSFSYSKQEILKKLSFEVGKGEVLIVLGPNGSGKTTLLKCLNMLLKPEGSIFIDTFDVSKLNGGELAKLMGYVPQIHSPAFPYKVVDVVVSGRTPHLDFSVPSEDDYKFAYKILEKLGLKNLAERPYTQLSGGELRLVLIARALVQQPKVLLLDEPTSHLDLKNKVLVLKVLREIANEGITVIMSEHDPNLAIFADKLLLINSGKIVAFGKAQNVLTKENIAKLYEVNVEIFERNGRCYIFPIF
ncbi:MAG: ABC transporter ATP-binding protein [Candidatus Methanospirare jalkutatii]|nr:MAG: ABC transporter ATP-binding protein [Candidatus Methanospirare jalkutatii]UYZ40414.1 MAG: ABC transporter ATP-binding protein [Candidatus Methanospirare jalkutatii]